MFSNNLKRLRKSKKLTQIQLAKKLGVAKTTLASYEQGRRMPDIEIQNKLADIFDVSLDQLHGRTSQQENENDTLMFNYIDGFTELSEEEQKRIIQQLEEQAMFLIDRAKKNK